LWKRVSFQSFPSTPIRTRMMKTTVVALALVGSVSAAVNKQTKFNYYSESGLIEFDANEALRLNIKGGVQEGSPLILYPCAPLNHELFKLDAGKIKLKANPSLCLNVAGGAVIGSKLAVWPCEHSGQKVPHEEFTVAHDGRIALKEHPDLCLNVKDGHMVQGAEVILWPCGTAAANEQFKFNDGLIQVRAHPEFHFNVQSDMAVGNLVVLWRCQAGPQEAFEFTSDDRIRLRNTLIGGHATEWCLNARGGLEPGKEIVAWPCHAQPESHELFKYDPKRRVIYSVVHKNLGFTVEKGGKSAGDKIILWHFEGHSEL